MNKELLKLIKQYNHEVQRNTELYNIYKDISKEIACEYLGRATAYTNMVSDLITTLELYGK